MTKIKICGLTNINDVELINNNKVEYAGFVVFVPKSKRNNDLQIRQSLLKMLDFPSFRFMERCQRDCTKEPILR